MAAVTTLQKAMCIMVSVTGYGKPAYERMYLLKRMTTAESEIQAAMRMYDLRMALLAARAAEGDTSGLPLIAARRCASAYAGMQPRGIPYARRETGPDCELFEASRAWCCPLAGCFGAQPRLSEAHVLSICKLVRIALARSTSAHA